VKVALVLVLLLQLGVCHHGLLALGCEQLCTVIMLLHDAMH